MFWQTFQRLCHEAKQSPGEAAKGIGIGYRTLKNWRKGSMPQERTLQRIADYFGLSIDTVMLEMGMDAPCEASPFPLTNLETRLIRVTRRLSADQQERLVETLESAVRKYRS